MDFFIFDSLSCIDSAWLYNTVISFIVMRNKYYAC